VGKPPIELFRKPQLDKALRHLLGTNYPLFEERLDVAGVIARQGDYVVGSGLLAHEGGSEEAYFAFGISRGDLHCAIMLREKISTYSSPGSQVPQELKALTQEGEARARSLSSH
jgi:hypothetical protein